MAASSSSSCQAVGFLEGDEPSCQSAEPTLECAICMGDMHNGLTLPCGHMFCADCFLTAVQDGGHTQCPTCRHPLRKSRASDIRRQLKKATLQSQLLKDRTQKLSAMLVLRKRITRALQNTLIAQDQTIDSLKQVRGMREHNLLLRGKVVIMGHRVIEARQRRLATTFLKARQSARAELTLARSQLEKNAETSAETTDGREQRSSAHASSSCEVSCTGRGAERKTGEFGVSG